MKQVLKYSDFLFLCNNVPAIKRGLFIDTNFLISVSYELDRFHDESRELYEIIKEENVNLFCNVNVRTEFLDIHRRIIITDALISANKDENLKKIIPFFLKTKIKSLESRRSYAEAGNKTPPKLSDYDLKFYAAEFFKIKPNDENFWIYFCKIFLNGQLTNIWNYAESNFNLKFLSLRKDESKEFIDYEPDWQNVINIIETYGISSSDAMIINMFLCSKFNFILTNDREVARIIDMLNIKDKFVIVPDQLTIN